MCHCAGDASLAAVAPQAQARLSAGVLASVVVSAALLTVLLGVMFHFRYRRQLQQARDHAVSA